MEDEVRMVGGVGDGWMGVQRMKINYQYGRWCGMHSVRYGEPKHGQHQSFAFIQVGGAVNQREEGDLILGQSVSGWCIAHI